MSIFKVKIYSYISVLTIVFFLNTGCSPNFTTTVEQKSTSSLDSKIANNGDDRAEIRDVFERQIKGLNTKNLDLAMSVISEEDSSTYEKTKEVTQKLLDTYDLDITINKLDILNILGDTAKVSVTQTTKKIKGPAFRDNKLVYDNRLKKINGHWKIVSSKIVNIQYLN